MSILNYIISYVLINILIIALVPAARNQYLEFIKSLSKKHTFMGWESNTNHLKRISKWILYIFLLVLFHCLIAIIAIPLLPFLIKNDRKRLIEEEKKRKTQGYIQKTKEGVIIEGFVGQMTSLKVEGSNEYAELILHVYSGAEPAYNRVIFWGELAREVVRTVDRNCKLRVEGELETITVTDQKGNDKQRDRTIAKSMQLLSIAKPITFGGMGGGGSIHCFDCKHEERITSFTHGAFEAFLGYQCQVCGKFHTLKSESEEYHKINIIDPLICDCGGELSRDKHLFCPECKSTRMSYGMRYMT